MIARVSWHPSYRLIAARLPRLDIFETVADPGDLDRVLELEALTNPRITEMVGPIAAIPVEDRLAGPGPAFVMAPFAYPSASRFGDGLAGVYYAGETLATAIAEVSFHRERFARSTPTPPMDFDERVIEADIDADLVDLRCEPATCALYDPDPANYPRARIEAKKARAAGEPGLVYNSVRRPGGECVAVFAPRLIVNARTTGYIGLRWDGTRINDQFRKESLTAIYPII